MKRTKKRGAKLSLEDNNLDSEETATSSDDDASTFRFDSCFWEDHCRPIYGCSFSPFILPSASDKDSIFAVAATNRITIYRCHEYEGTSAIQCYKDSDANEMFFCVTWLYDPEDSVHFVAAAGAKGIIRIICPTEGTCVKALLGHGEAINELRTHPKHSVVLLSASQDWTVRLWNARLGICVGILGGGEGHVDQILSADFDLTGDRVVTGSMDHCIKVWALHRLEFSESGVAETIQLSLDKEFDPLTKTSVDPSRCCYPIGSTSDIHSNYVDCVRWFGHFIISKSCDETICIWKLGGSEELGFGVRSSKPESNATPLYFLRLPNTDIWFLRFALSPDFKYLAAGNRIGKIYVWKLDSKSLETDKPSVLQHPKSKRTIRQLDFSPDGKALLGVQDDGTIWRWNLS